MSRVYKVQGLGGGTSLRWFRLLACCHWYGVQGVQGVVSGVSGKRFRA